MILHIQIYKDTHSQIHTFKTKITNAYMQGKETFPRSQIPYQAKTRKTRNSCQ